MLRANGKTAGGAIPTTSESWTFDLALVPLGTSTLLVRHRKTIHYRVDSADSELRFGNDDCILLVRDEGRDTVAFSWRRRR